MSARRTVGRPAVPSREALVRGFWQPPVIRTSVLARPTGVKPTRTHPGLKSIPIEGADDWEVATSGLA